jgi:hypothetical protein
MRLFLILVLSFLCWGTLLLAVDELKEIRGTLVDIKMLLVDKPERQ